MIVYENEYYKLEYDESLEAIILSYKLECELDMFRESCSKMIDIVKDKGCYKQITDVKNIQYLDREYLIYADEVVTPEMVKYSSLGKMYIAGVVDKDPLTLFIVKTLLHKSVKNAEFRYFNNIAKAKKWLASV